MHALVDSLLAHVTSELTAPATSEDIADVVQRVARESLGALSARVMVVDGGCTGAHRVTRGRPRQGRGIPAFRAPPHASARVPTARVSRGVSPVMEWTQVTPGRGPAQCLWRVPSPR